MTLFPILNHICQNSTAMYATKNMNMTMRQVFVQTPVTYMTVTGNPLFSNNTLSNLRSSEDES